MSNMIRERSSGDSLTEELAAMYWESHNVVVMVIIFLLHHSWTIVFTQFYKVASLPHTMTPLKNLFLHLQLYKCINLFPFSSQKCHYNFCIKLFHAEVLYWYMGYFFFKVFVLWTIHNPCSWLSVLAAWIYNDTSADKTVQAICLWS